MKQDIFKNIEENIKSSDINKEVQDEILEKMFDSKKEKLNLLITGATGCGKSSTINAMFEIDIAKVGTGVNPQTMTIQKYELDNLILWDSPGLGDGKEKDIQHSKAIISKLNELNSNDKPLIDLILVILDGSSRDLGTSYELINSVIIPQLGESAKNRILIAINQADLAMKGRYWDFEQNQPEEKLKNFLDEKVESVKYRIKEATDVDVEPIYYSAGFQDDDEIQKPYNLSKLLHYIITNTPTKKRLLYTNNISDDETMWTDDDKQKDYRLETQTSIWESFKEVVGGAWDSFKETEIYDDLKEEAINFIKDGIKEFLKKKKKI